MLFPILLVNFPQSNFGEPIGQGFFYDYHKIKVNDRFFLYGKHFQRSREHKILLPLSIMEVQKKTNQKFIVDECATHMNLFSIQALSLELPALTITKFTVFFQQEQAPVVGPTHFQLFFFSIIIAILQHFKHNFPNAHLFIIIAMIHFSDLQ